MRIKLVVLALIALLAGLALAPGGAVEAQESFCNSGNLIAAPRTIEGRINDSNFVFFYCIEGRAGQTLTVSAAATSGNLDTLIGLSDEFGDTIFAENDDIESGNTNSAFQYTFEDDGTYVIIMTRFNLSDGTSNGEFELNVSLSGGGSSGNSGPGLGTTGTNGGNSGNTDPAVFEYPALGDGTNSAGLGDGAIFVTCDSGVRIRGGVQFSFINVNPGFSYTVTAIGLDGFDPVLAVETEQGIGTCNDDTPAVAGSRVSVPGFGNVTATQLSSQVRFTSPRRGFPVNISVGSFNDQPGRFVMVIEGFAISPFTEQDGFAVRVPASVQEEPLGVYMVARYTDLDPYMFVAMGEGLNQGYDSAGNFDYEVIDFNTIFGPLFECDDAGRGACDFSPNFPSGPIDISNGSSYNPGSVDAGLMLVPNTTDPILYVFGSLNGASGGTYAILVTGTVPGAD